MGEGGQGRDKRKRGGQKRGIVDVGGDIKKVKGTEEKEKLKKDAERRKGLGTFPFYVRGAEAGKESQI